MATYLGCTFDWLLPGFAQTRAGMVTVRTPPGAEVTYVDLGSWAGPTPDGWRVDLKFATLADFQALQEKVGGYGELVYAADEPAVWAVLLSLTRSWRKGTGPQLAHAEWTVFQE